MKKLIILFLISGLFLAGCSCTSCEKDEKYHNIPDNVLLSAERYVKNRTGEEFFNNYISPNYEKSKRVKENYFVWFTFRDLDRPWINEEISFMMSEKGKVVKSYDIVGIPDCEEEGSCKFDITPDEVNTIALGYGLPEGVKKWDKSFRWSGEFNQYIWHVLVTVNEAGRDDNYKANGEELILSPVTGEVIKHRIWNIR